MCYTRLAENTGRKKSPKIAIWALSQSRNFVGQYLRNEGMYRQSEKNLLNSNISRTCPYNMVNFGLLAAEIGVWGTPANFNGFGVLATLLHGTLVVGVSQTLRHWTEGANYIRQGDHHVGHCPHSSSKCYTAVHVWNDSWRWRPAKTLDANLSWFDVDVLSMLRLTSGVTVWNYVCVCR